MGKYDIFFKSLNEFYNITIIKISQSLHEDNPKIFELGFKGLLISSAFGTMLKYKDVTDLGYVLLDFNIFGRVFSSLKSDSCLNAVAEIIRRNIEAGLLNDDCKLSNLDSEKIISIIDKSIKLIAVQEVITLDSIMEQIAKTWKEQKNTKDGTITDVLGTEIHNIEKIKKHHTTFKAHYLDKLTTYTREDLELVIESLNGLGLDENALEKVKNELEIQLYRREAKEEKELAKRKREKLFSVDESSSVEIKPVIPKKEFQLIYRELNQYFDVENMKAIKFLSLKDIIYCIHLMLKLNYKEDIINEFVKSIEKENKKIQNNPISLFIRLYDKFKYYEKNINIQEKIKYIESLLGEIFICDEEDYEFWKLSIEEEMDNLLSMIPSNYEYEVSEAKKLQK